ncbi:MAG: CoA-binding protein [Candidatus Hydrogenedentes bacterium]|nr:CoA-binding protein [Candidatus Hydrogenedentota bacterium]
MTEVTVAIQDFLAQKRIAVAGVSSGKGIPANAIYCRLRDTGHTVFAVNPSRTTAEGDPCYPDLQSLPEKVDAVVAATSPKGTESIVQQCVALGIPRVWIHQSLKSFGTSVSDEAVRLCRENNITVIPGGCPMMFCEPVDVAHKCMRWLSRVTGNLPASV